MLFSSTECCVQQRAIREKGNKTARMKFNEPRILFHFPPITTALKFHAHQQGEKLRIKKKRSSSSADNREKIGRHITRSSIISCGFVLHNVSPPPMLGFCFPFWMTDVRCGSPSYFFVVVFVFNPPLSLC